MRAVVQRVTRAQVMVAGDVVGEIANGLVIFLGIAREDAEKDCDYLADKIIALRIFEDADSKMNLSLSETKGELLVVSQFTLYGDVRRGLRPSWFDAAAPEVAEPLYGYFVARCRTKVTRIATGSFRKMMQVELVNDGPVTILIDSSKQF